MRGGLPFRKGIETDESQNGRKNMAKVVLTTQRTTDYMRNKSNIRPAPDRIFLLERSSLSVESIIHNSLFIISKSPETRDMLEFLFTFPIQVMK